MLATEFLVAVEPAERYDEVVRFSLDNGMRVLLRRTSGVPIVSTYIWYRVGSRFDVEGKTGMAHLLEHMTFKGTTEFPDTSIASEVMRNGGAFDAFTGRDYTAFYETLPASHLDLALRIERDRMINAQITDDAFASELGVVVSEMEECQNNPEWLLSEAVLDTAFRVHPYRFPTIGRRNDLNNIGRNDLVAHYKTHYHPQKAVLAIAGDFNIDAAIRRIDQLFSPIRAGATPTERLAREPRQEQERRVAIERPGSAQSFHCVYRSCGSGNPDVFALLVLTSLLSGVSAFSELTLRRSGRLYRAFIEPRLAAFVTGYYQPARDPGPIHFCGSLPDGSDAGSDAGGDRAAFEAVFDREIERLAEEIVTDHELDRMRKLTRAEFAYAMERASNQARWTGWMEILGWEGVESLLTNLLAVEAGDIRRVARCYFEPRARTIGWTLPVSS